MGVSEKSGPSFNILNSRILLIRTPNKVPLIFGHSHTRLPPGSVIWVIGRNGQVVSDTRILGCDLTAVNFGRCVAQLQKDHLHQKNSRSSLQLTGLRTCRQPKLYMHSSTARPYPLSPASVVPLQPGRAQLPAAHKPQVVFQQARSQELYQRCRACALEAGSDAGLRQGVD